MCGDRGEPLIEYPRSVTLGRGFPAFLVPRVALRFQNSGEFSDPLPTVGHDQGDKGASAGDRREHQLCPADRVAHRDPLEGCKVRVAQQFPGSQPEYGQSGCRGSETCSQRVADPPQSRRPIVVQA
jgi:hypothetical protein